MSRSLGAAFPSSPCCATASAPTHQGRHAGLIGVSYLRHGERSQLSPCRARPDTPTACLWPGVPVVTIDRHESPANHQMRQQAGHQQGGKGPMQQRPQTHDKEPHVS